MVDDTSRLLGLDGLAVVGVTDGPQGLVVQVNTADERARMCPECGTRARRSKGRRTTRPRDLQVGGRRPQLVWTKRRWLCEQAECRRKSFTESVPEVPPRKRLTARLRSSAGAAVADRGRTVVQAGRDHDVSWPVASAAFTFHAQQVLPAQPDPVEVLGVDEVRRGRPRWVFDEAAGSWVTVRQRWHVGFCDLSGGQGLLGQVEGRNAAVMADWLAAREQSWRDQVKFVAIDMCTIFKSAIGRMLPNATLVVDHFHLVQLANQALTEVRRRVTVQVRGRRGRKGNREWELRNRLTRCAARMPGEHVDALVDELSTLPAAIAAPILAAWNAKEDLLDLLALARINPDRRQVARRLHRFYTRCAEAGVAELERLAATVETWWPQILAFLHTGITNAGSEGTNRVIKTVARDAYGFRNAVNQRLRTRCATTRKTRGHLDPH
ncbi:ISL3 family transposase [Natronosporangium hydrolyticum]|uniref:ISL3 family transposase n=1 Tax=Natronosporangium hydrolyticum TaxID=2811111 RepID=A0A895YGC1_9ACTN|nr:ISL3 family transposase [Natronosporangium hydrolyticum]QSB16867.1 ISL3 family transposase [Natronosporangium hydrolyticum]